MNKNDFLNKLNIKEINKFTYYTYGYQKDFAKNENVSLGYIPFLNNFGFEEVEQIIPLTNPNNRCGIKKDKTYYIVVHDTASAAPSAGADAHAKWLMSMASDINSKTCVSWHFTVDDHKIINHIPVDEVAYHAGDGTRVKLEFTDTKVKYEGVPVITVSEDGYFIINGQKTDIQTPRDNNGNVCYNLPYQGINTLKSKNDTYLISNTYYNEGYDCISNRGGNLNSVGIESCVNYEHDYIKTMRILAYLVAKLLVQFNLDIDSVKQHNSFSGKDCPMTIRKAHMWEEFINLVEVNLFNMRELKDVDVKFTSLSKDYLDDSGQIIKYESGKVIQYKVSIGDEEYIFNTKLI